MEADMPSADGAGAGGTMAVAMRLPLQLPATMSVEALMAILGPTDATAAPITEERIHAPDEALLLHIYSTLLTLPALREAVALHGSERQEHERRNVDMETQLHDAERLKSEAEARAEEDRLAKEAAIQAKNEVDGQLAKAQGTLAALQSNAETGVQQSAEVKGRLDALEQEKRGILEMLEREKLESARRAEEIDGLTSRSREARTEVNRLSTELQEAKSSLSSAKFKNQSLEQELALKIHDATWAHQELSKTSEELAQYRVRSHGEISSLTSQLQQTSQALEASEGKVSALQSAYEQAQTRLDESTRDKSELRQRLVEQEGAFKSEMATQQRLAGLMEHQKDNAERRLADIEEQWERTLAQHAEREEALRQEIAHEQEAQEAIVREKDEVQQALDRLASSVGIDTEGYQLSVGDGTTNDGANASTNGSGLATPKRGLLGMLSSPAIFSPTAALASKVQKSGKSFTQVYADLAIAEESLRREKSENRRLGLVLEQVMAEVQDRAPAMQAQREKLEELEARSEEMSATVASVCQERDFSEREAKEQRLRAEASQRENGLLNQQVSDLIRQVRDLSREIVVRDNPALEQQLASDGTQIGDPTSASLASVSMDTQAIINEQLVSFRSLTELVTQNSRLLRVVRQLGAEMEQRESQHRASYESQENEAIDEAKQVIVRLQEDLRAERTRSEGVRRERDMFRAMTAQGRGSSALATATSAGVSTEPNAAHVTLTHQYGQLQAQFEAFRSETANDMERLKEEAYQARSEASKSALAAAKESAARENAEERLMNAQQTYSMEHKDLQDLQRRHAALQESLSRQEITAQNIGQQLVTAHSNVERLRNENSNLAAEKDLHKETTNRLLEEKNATMQERANLSELLRSTQTMQAEMERSSAEVRRRLETQVEKLDEQCRDLRDRATKEEEAHRQTSLRREVETTELRTKLDRASEELARIREEHAVAKNSVQHLTTRSEDLQKQVHAKDEKLAVYERRTASGTGAAVATGSGTSGDLNREQILQVEVADLKGELRSAQVEAEQSRAHADQFKAIAAANEEALGQLQASYDQYKAVTDGSIAEKDSELTSLRERNQALASELTTAQNEASAERQEREKQAEAFRIEKKTLEDAMSEVTSIEDRARSSRESMQQEVRRQVQLTQDAHSKYEVELLAHAEDVKALTTVKEELGRVRTDLLEAQKAQETAQGNLASSTDSWARQRELIEREKEDLKKITVELRGQNEALHKHLETLQAQTNEIRRQVSAAPATSGGVAPGDTSTSSQTGSDELHEVIRYLRREKEIVDLQVELREQECARLRQSVEHMQRSLDEVRMQLTQEREQKAGASASAKQHEELLEKINQLSILRESNTTLRDEMERATRKVQTLETRVETLTRELEPVREELHVKTVELEACQNQLRLSQEDNKRWQGRTQSILQQYNRIDPDELKVLQEKKEQAETALEALKVESETQKQAANEKFERLRQQTVERIRQLRAELDASNKEIASLKAGIAQGNEDQASQQRSEVERLQGEMQQLEARAAELEGEKVVLAQQVEALQAQVNEGGAQPADADTGAVAELAVEEARKAWDMERQLLETKYAGLEKREQAHLQQARTKSLESRDLKKERDALLAEKEQWVAGNAATGDGENASPDLEALRQRITELEAQLEQANQRVQDLEAANAGSGEAADTGQLMREHDAAMREQEGRLSAQFLERQKKAVEVAVQKAHAASDAASGGGMVEEEVQNRLKQFEDARLQEQQAALQAKEQELRAHYDEQLKARYQAGKDEATLRNTLLLKTRESKIEKLTAEINALKGVNSGADAAVTAPSDAGLPVRPMAVSIRGGAAPRPVGRPSPPTTAGSVAVRGEASVRGNGRGGAVAAAAGAQKRKLDQAQASVAAAADAPATGAAQQGSVPKKPRAAGGPIAVRGGAGGRGGAANRGGRGGAAQGGG